MGLCGSIERGNSGRITYNESSPPHPQATGNSSRYTSNPDRADSRLEGLRSLNSSRSASQTSNLSAVTQVMRSVRSGYYKKPRLKSSNKRKNEGYEEALRVYNATREIERMRNEVDSLEEDIVSSAMYGNAHNCGELAVLAVHQLQQDHNLIARLAFLGGRTHTTAIIGPVPGAGPLPSDMTEWNADIYVCDPWCNIACRANHYPEKFREKMEKWDREGKKVWLSGTGFVSPMDDRWVRTVLGGEKTTA